MAFANEVKDFIDAFQVGAKIKDMSKRRKLDEQEAKDRVSIAQMKQKASDDRFNKTYDQNERKLSEANRRWDADYGLREQEAARRAADSAALDKYRGRTLKIQEDAAGERKRKSAISERKAALAEDPTRILDDEPQGALPTNVTPQTPQPKQGIAVSDQPQPKPSGVSPGGAIAAGAGAATAMGMGVAPGTVAKALSGGLSYLQNHFGIGGAIQGAGAKSEDGARRLFEGEGTMTPEEQNAVDQLLDDEDRANGVTSEEMTDSMRAIRRLTRTYDKLLSRGKTEEANAMAASIIQSSRGVASMLGAQSLKKLQAGDVAGAAQDLVAAHDQIPDGRSVKFDPESMTFVISDEETGEELEKGQVTPEAIFSMANGFKDGSAFYRVVMDAAKRDKSMQNPKGETEKEPKALDPMSIEEANAVTDPEMGAAGSVMGEIKKLRLPDDSLVFPEGMPDEKIIENIGQDTIEAISDLGQMVAQYNGIRPEQAGMLAMSIVNPDLSNTEKPGWNFKLINSSKDVMEIMTEDGTRLRLPARTAASMIKRGNAGLYRFASELHGRNETKAIDQAVRDADVLEQEEGIAVAKKKAADKAATQAFDRDMIESIHGPGGTEASTLASQQGTIKRRPQRTLKRT